MNQGPASRPVKNSYVYEALALTFLTMILCMQEGIALPPPGGRAMPSDGSEALALTFLTL
jgi:hypothetical protein